MIVYRVLGFGGKPNPLVYSRVASMAMRTGQGLLGSPVRRHQEPGLARCRGQLYVDDPTWVNAGKPEEVQMSADILLQYWMILGIPLAWAKGSWQNALEEHLWIGVVYTSCLNGPAVMTLPKAFVSELCDELKAFTRDSGTVSLKLAERVVGRAGRVAQIVPEARPFAGALWTALTAAKKANDAGPKEAPPGKAAVRRFTVASRWMSLLLRQDPEAPFVLRREVFARGPKPASRSSWAIEFDASIYGGGAVLKHGDTPHEYFIK